MLYSSLASANSPITVLKFGGSVLAGPDALADAVAEIRRSLEAGSRVVAVTSAFSGVTERLLESARARFRAPAGKPLASLLATGESRSAAFLSLALDDASILNELVDPDAIGLRVHGTWLDGEPVDVDIDTVHKALGKAPVLVVPGFFGRRRDGSLALLGRGGSDLTAIFLAHRLGAEECRLVKDVDGLFSCDPNGEPVPPDRFETATWNDLAKVGGGLVQSKAIELARTHEVPMTIAAPLSRLGTRVTS